MVVLAWLKLRWPWLAGALALALLLSAGRQGYDAWHRHHQRTQLDALAGARATATAQEAAAARRSDSVANHTAGRLYELRRQQALLQHADESLSTRPAVQPLPASPPPEQ